MTTAFLALIFPAVGSTALAFAHRSLMGDEKRLFKAWNAALQRRADRERLDSRFTWIASGLLSLGCLLGFLGVLTLPITPLAVATAAGLPSIDVSPVAAALSIATYVMAILRSIGTVKLSDADVEAIVVTPAGQPS